MATFKFGDKGPKVRKLQQALMAAGFNPGLIDGDYGAGTEAALIAYQRSANLLADGVGGPRTLKALGLARTDKLESAIDRFSIQVVAQMFVGAPLSNVRNHLPVVLDAMQAAGLVDRTMLLMALCSIRAETAGFAPINEGISRYNTSPRGHEFDLYDARTDIGNRKAPDGERFRGRGFIQLTGRANYDTYGKRLAVPLVAQPELANDPIIAAQLLTCFLGDRERKIKEAVLEDNLRQARKLVNGGSHGLSVFTEAWAIGDRLTADV